MVRGYEYHGMDRGYFLTFSYFLRMSWMASSNRLLKGLSRSIASFLISFWRSLSIFVDKFFFAIL